MHVTGHKDATGLSCSTTSRVADGHATVNEEIQEQAQAGVEALGRSRHATALAQFGSVTRSLSVLVSDIALDGCATTWLSLGSKGPRRLLRAACAPPPPPSGGGRNAQAGTKVTRKRYVTTGMSASARESDDLAAVALAIGIPPPTPPPAIWLRPPGRSAAPRSPAPSRTPATGV